MTALRRSLVALVAALALFFALACLLPGATLLAEASPAPAHTYDAPVYGTLSAGAGSERGPAAVSARGTTYDAIDRWSPSAPLLLETAESFASTAGTVTATPPRVVAATPTTRVPGVEAIGVLSAVQRSGVAANGERLLAKADRIEAHLARPEIGYAAKNDAMLARIRAAAVDGTPLSRADRAFMRHELTENWLMNRGMGIDLAHRIAGWTHRTYGNFDPSVIKQLPQEFNSNWRRFWDIE